MGTRKYLSDDSKHQIVQEALLGEKTHTQISREHNICAQSISRWKREFGYGRSQSSKTRERFLEAKIEQLERKIGQLVLENGVLKKTVLLVRQSQIKKKVLSPHTETDSR